MIKQNTVYRDTLRGVDKVYVQVAVDIFCSAAFAKAYRSKMPITACNLLYDRVLPFHAELDIKAGAVLAENGREFCGRLEQHPQELLLAVDGVERGTTKVRSPRTNGLGEHKDRTLLDERIRVKGCTTWYMVPKEIQRRLAGNHRALERRCLGQAGKNDRLTSPVRPTCEHDDKVASALPNGTRSTRIMTGAY